MLGARYLATGNVIDIIMRVTEFRGMAFILKRLRFLENKRGL